MAMGKAQYKREMEAEAKAAALARSQAAAAASSPDVASADAASAAAASEPADPADALTSEDAALLAGLRGKLARYPGPAYRKAYLANLMESGKRYLIAQNSRAAAYCFDKVSEAFAAALTPTAGDVGDSDPAAQTSEGMGGSGGETIGGSGDAADEAALATLSALSDKTRKPNRPGSARPRAKAKAPTPTDIFRRNWREARLKDAEMVLNRHGSRLSALENKAYRERLDKLRQSALTATGPQSDRIDAGLLDLRRRLYGRVLKSQKIALKRSRMPMTLARLALPPAARESQAPAPATLPARTPARSGKVPAVHVDAAWQPVVGPYNDRYNMEDLLSLIADADAAWVEEFLDLYRGLSGLQNLMVSISALKKS